MRVTSLGAYVHFPWCVAKCPYCDFNSHPVRGSLDEAGYLRCLLVDLDDQLESIDAPITSVFFGGGTPSLFSPRSFATLLERLAPHLDAACEITMEANPGATEHGALADYRAAGINRLSLGGQSFSDDQLRVLGRIHAARETMAVFDDARAAGFDNINLDLMYSLPRQSPDDALADLEQAIALAPEHISWYQLTLEPKTEFAKRPPSLPDERVTDEVEHRGRQRLHEAGYQRYEVSAYAKATHQCAHNLNYWRFGDYLGVGAGAHGKASHTTPDFWVERTTKASQPRRYMATAQHTERTPIPSNNLAEEFFMNTLRLVDGVERSLFAERTGLSIDTIAEPWRRLSALGLVREDRLATTSRGYRLLDSVLTEFL